MLLFTFLIKKKLITPVDDGITSAIKYAELIDLRGGCTDKQLLQRIGQLFGTFGSCSLHNYNFDPIVMDYRGRRSWFITKKGGVSPVLEIYCMGEDHKQKYSIKYTGKSLVKLIRWIYKIPE